MNGDVRASDVLGSLFRGIGVLLILSIIYFIFFSDYSKERDARREAAYAAEKQRDSQPRVIREVDGCKVYTFKEFENTGRWVFFARCSDGSAMTQTDYTQNKTTYQQTVPTTK